MTRARISTTVDADLLAEARGIDEGATDSSMVEAALRALLAAHRAAAIDAAYTAYDEHPVTESDAWGDLASFRQAAARS